MRIIIKNNLNVTLDLCFTEAQAKSIIASRKPMSKAMDIVRHRLGEKHGFYPVKLLDYAA